MHLKGKLHSSRKENQCLLESRIHLIGLLLGSVVGTLWSGVICMLVRYRVVKVPPKTILQELALQQSIGINFPCLGVNITIDGKIFHLYQLHTWKIVSACYHC